MPTTHHLDWMQQQNADPTQPPFLGLPQGKRDGDPLDHPSFPEGGVYHVDSHPTPSQLRWWVSCAAEVIGEEARQKLLQMIASAESAQWVGKHIVHERGGFRIVLTREAQYYEEGEVRPIPDAWKSSTPLPEHVAAPIVEELKHARARALGIPALTVLAEEDAA